MQALPQSGLGWDDTTNICMNLITTCWFMNMIFSSSVTASNLYIKVRDYLRRRRERITDKVYPMENYEDLCKNAENDIDEEISPGGLLEKDLELEKKCIAEVDIEVGIHRTLETDNQGGERRMSY